MRAGTTRLEGEGAIVVARLRPTSKGFVDSIVELANIDLGNVASVANAVCPYKRIDEWIESSPNPHADQRLLRKRLDQLIAGETANLSQRLSADVGLLSATGGLVIDSETKEMSWMFAVELHNLRHGIAYVLASLLQDHLVDRVHRCTLTECRKYFVDWPGERGKAGWDAKYCCKKHNDRDRSRRYRERKKLRVKK